MSIVLDTNILVSSLSARIKAHWIIEAIREERFAVVISHEILLEYEEILILKYGVGAADAFISFLQIAENVEAIETYFFWNLLNDPDDNKFVDAAIAAGADFLVTEDRDFRRLRNVDFPEVTVLNLSEFENLLNNT